MTDLQNLTVAQLRQAITIKEEIEALQAELSTLVGGEAPAPEADQWRRGMSAAGRARIAAAQRARWAKINAGKATVADGEAPPKKRRKMSAAGRAKIAAAARARWAKVKAAGKNSL